MRTESRLRLFLFFAVAAAHIVLIMFVAINISTVSYTRQTAEQERESETQEESPRVMKLLDITELVNEVYLPPPPPNLPPPPEMSSDIPVVESIAENMIEAEEVPEQIVVAPGTLTTYGTGEEFGYGSVYGTGTERSSSWDAYLPSHLVTDPPVFDEKKIARALVYPPIALRSGIEGRVILELFVDRSGVIQRIEIRLEDPPNRGFGEAAVKAFAGISGKPAKANGEAVSSRYRYPVSFRIR